MNPFVYPVICSICGGKGMAADGDAYMFGAVHKNPDVCRQILENKADDLKRR